MIIEENETVSNNTTEGTTTTNNSNLHSAGTSTLNLDDGKAGICLEKILQYRSRHGGIERQREKLDKGKSILEEITKGRRLTSGLLVSRGEHSLNNQSVLDCLKERNRREEKQMRKAQMKARKELRERISFIVNLRLTKPDMSKWSGKECSTYLQYKKQKGDPKMPKGVTQLRSRCTDVAHRPSPLCSQHPSDDEQSDDDTIVGVEEMALFSNNEEVIQDMMPSFDDEAENDRSHEL